MRTGMGVLERWRKTLAELEALELERKKELQQREKKRKDRGYTLFLAAESSTCIF